MIHERADDIPQWVKWGLTIFNRAGFPAIAFGVLAYLLFVKMEQQTDMIHNFNVTLSEMKSAMDASNETNKRLIEAIYRTRTR